MIMQQKSIYNENYKPLFISEMDDEMIKDFSKMISQKLRHVKLAISKANLNQNKYKTMNDDELDEEKKNNKKMKTRKKEKKKEIKNDNKNNLKKEVKFF